MSERELKRLNDQIQELAKQLGKQIEIFDMDNINAAEATLKGLKVEINEILSDVGGIAASFKATVAELGSVNEITNGIKKSFRQLEGISKQLLFDQQGILTLSTQELEKLKARAEIERTNLSLSRDLLEQKEELSDKEQDALDTINGQLASQQTLLNELNAATNARLAQEERINEALGLSSGLIGGIRDILNKAGFGSLSERLGLDQAQEDMRLVGDEITKGGKETASFGDKFRILGTGVKSIGSSIVENFKDPLVITGFLVNGIIDSFVKLDTSTGNLAKNLNLSYQEAAALNKELVKSAAASGDIFVTSQGLAESLSFINQTLGARVKISNEDLTTFTKLREVAGLTNEELMGITSLTRANGENLRQNTDELLLQVSALNEASGIQLNEKDILKDIGQISAATTLSLGKNPRLLADAAQTAKRLGLELSQVESIADSLLNFESSITNELEAEVLLGRDLNLERARLAALNNDIATVAREISTQVGGAAEFSRLNRIQQEALAQSVGMSRDDLGQQLFIQEQLVGLTGDQAAARERLLNARIEEVGLEQAQREGIETLEQQASIQEKINASVEKLATAFDSVAVALLPVLDLFSGLLSVAGKIIQIIEPIMGVIGGAAVGFATGGPIGALIGAGVGAVSDINRSQDVALAEGGIITKPIRALVGEAGAEAVIPLGSGQQIGVDMKETNSLLKTLVTQNSKKPELSPVGLYEIQ